jgi:hypothetical protein
MLANPIPGPSPFGEGGYIVLFYGFGGALAKNMNLM